MACGGETVQTHRVIQDIDQWAFDSDDRPIIVFCPGVEYLFWSMGVYYTWELAGSYRIVLLLESAFENQKQLEELKLKGVIWDVIAAPSLPVSYLGFRRAYARHRHFLDAGRAVFKKYRPVAVIQHTDIQAENIYVFELACRAGARRIIYRPTKAAKNYYDDYLLMREEAIERIRRKIQCPRWMAVVYFSVRKYFSYYLNYWVYPLLLTVKVFHPRIDAIAKKKAYINGTQRYFDYILSHERRDCEIARQNGEPSVQIRSPLRKIGSEANRFLYGDVKPLNHILILPTSGEIYYVKRRDGLSDQEAVEMFASHWSKAVDILRQRFPEHDVYLKVHPMQVCDPLFQRVVKHLKFDIPNLIVLPPQTNAQQRILMAKVVVSTISAVLWWAQQLEDDRVLISLNLFNVPGGDWYADADGVLYFNNFDDLERHPFAGGHASALRSRKEPTLREFLREVIATPK